MARIVLVCFAFVCLCTATLTVLTPSSASNTTIRIWPQKYKGNTVNFAPFIGEVVYSTYSNKTGKIVVIRDCAPPVEDIYRALQSEGAISILCALKGYPGSVPGHQMYAVDGSDTSDIIVPIASIHIGDIEEFMDANEAFLVLVSTESNEFMVAYESYWIYIWQATIALCVLANMCLICMRLYQLFVYYKGFSPSVAFFCILLLLIATLAMAVGVCVDPLGTYNIYNYWLFEILFTLSLPFVLAPLMLMALWWQNILGSLRTQISPGLSKYSWVFYLWISFVIIQELISSIIRSIFQDTITLMAYISATCYIISSIGVLIYCSVTLYRLRKRVDNMALRSARTKNELEKIKYRMIAVVTLIVILFISYVVFVTRITEFPVTRMIFWWVFWVFQSLLIATQALTVGPPKRSHHATTAESNVPRERGKIRRDGESIISRLDNSSMMDGASIMEDGGISPAKKPYPIEESSSSGVDEEYSDEPDKVPLSPESKRRAAGQLKGWRSAFGAFKKNVWSSSSISQKSKSMQVIRRPTFKKKDFGNSSSDSSEGNVMEAIEEDGDQEVLGDEKV